MSMGSLNSRSRLDWRLTRDRWFQRVAHLALVVMLPSAPVLAVAFTTWPVSVKMFVALFFLIISLYLVLIGRDFFTVYIGRTLLAVGLLHLAALISMRIALETKSTPQRSQFVDVTTPGTALTIFVATVTVVGFTITITRLHEAHIRISSYDQFLARLARLLELKVRSRVGRKLLNVLNRPVGRLSTPTEQEGIKVLCTTPTLGNMSHPRQYYSQVYPLWKKVAEAQDLPFEIVCVNAELTTSGLDYDSVSVGEKDGIALYHQENFEEESTRNKLRSRLLENTSIGRFYQSAFGGERDFKPWQVVRGALQAIELCRKFKNGGRDSNKPYYYEWPKEGDPLPDLPPFHLFWTRERAIVAVPLDRGLRRDDMERGVTLVGYETTDDRVIHRLLQVYEEWRTKLDSPPKAALAEVELERTPPAEPPPSGDVAIT